MSFIKETKTLLCFIKTKLCNTKILLFHGRNTNKRTLPNRNSAHTSLYCKPQVCLRLTNELKSNPAWVFMADREKAAE